MLIALGGGALRGSDEDLEAKFAEANAKLEQGENQAAVELYNTILEAEPRAENVWINRAIAKWKLQDPSGARADLAQAISLNPKNVASLRLRASLRYQAQDFQGSLGDIEAALRLNDADAELHGMHGEILSALGSRERARDALTRAIALKKDYTAAYFMRGQVHEDLDRPDAAFADYNRVIALEPRHADALNNRGWIYFHRLDWDAAIADAEAVIALAPKAAIAHRLLGYAAFGRGDYPRSAATLADAAGLTTQDPETSAFALIVRHFALMRGGGADKRLATSWGTWKDEWLQGLARFVVGQIDEDALERLVEAAVGDDERAGRACEAHFYIGLKRLAAGDKSTARLRFQSAVRTDKRSFIEHALAQAELKRL